MATRSTINMRMADGSIKGIYSHWDGYPSWNGKILRDHYNTKEKVEALINMGSVSSLKETLEETRFYKRDMGEGDETTAPRIYKHIETLLEEGQEYDYIFEHDGNWHLIKWKSPNHSITIDEAIDNDN